MKYAKSLLISLCLAVAGCTTTITPIVVEAPVASWDGLNQNSGFIGWTDNGSGIITRQAKEQYNILIGTYGSRFVPPLITDFGIFETTTNTFIITPQALADFATMKRWRRAGG